MENFNGIKRLRVHVLVIAILLLFSSFLTFDWTQYWFGIVRVEKPEWMYSRITKTLTSIFIFVLAWSTGSDGIGRKDSARLKACFAAILCGDLCFFMDEWLQFFDYIAITSFLAGHVTIIFRNGQGLKKYFAAASWRGIIVKDILSGCIIIAAVFILFSYTLLEHLRGTALMYVLIVYAMVLSVSLWTGWAVLRTGYFPAVNGLMIAAGATCFFAGDYIVGFNLSLQPGIGRATTLFLTWIFYAPAIFLFALSGYRWRGEKQAD